MHLYDVTLTISGDLPVRPGDPPVILERIQKIEAGAVANVTRLDMGAHVGTHVDAPFHFLGGQAATVEQLSLQKLVGRAYVLQIPAEVGLITAGLLEKLAIPPRTRRLVLKTRNSACWQRLETHFQTDFVGLSADAASYLVDRGIQLIGVDYLSVAPYDAPAQTHTILLKAGVVIVEGLNLSAIEPGRYTIYCLPLKLQGADGAPARVILVGV